MFTIRSNQEKDSLKVVESISSEKVSTGYRIQFIAENIAIQEMLLSYSDIKILLMALSKIILENPSENFKNYIEKPGLPNSVQGIHSLMVVAERFRNEHNSNALPGNLCDSKIDYLIYLAKYIDGKAGS